MSNISKSGEHCDQKANEKVLVFPERQSIRSQANAWIARLEVREPGTDDLEEFRHWINEDPKHLSEFERLNAMWGDLNILTQLTPACKQEQRASAGDRLARWYRGKGWWAGAVMASVFLLVSLMVVQWQPVIYQTDVGEQQTIILPDYSVVNLNTNSRIRIDYSDSRRGIYLTQGEAHFEVRKDAARPFEVYAGVGLVRAVGTAFNVRLHTDNVEVIVIEGVVEVDPFVDQIDLSHTSAMTNSPKTLDSRRQPARLAAGEQATYHRTKPKPVAREKTDASVNKLAWREGTLEFKRELLENVVAEVSRYTDKNIVIMDEHTRQQRVGGRFKVGDTKMLLEVLASGFGITVSRVEGKTIYLSNDVADDTSMDIKKNPKL
jgi:transmembrane sensor